MSLDYGKGRFAFWISLRRHVETSRGGDHLSKVPTWHRKRDRVSDNDSAHRYSGQQATATISPAPSSSSPSSTTPKSTPNHPHSVRWKAISNRCPIHHTRQDGLPRKARTSWQRTKPGGNPLLLHILVSREARCTAITRAIFK